MTFQEEITKKFENLGWKVLKLIRLNENGFPDLMIIKNGVVSFIEVKEENDTLKPLQKKRIMELRALGIDAWCVQKTKGIVF